MKYQAVQTHAHYNMNICNKNAKNGQKLKTKNVG